MAEEIDSQTPSDKPVGPAPTGYAMPPLTAVEWMFPLGGCDAKLSIVAMPGCVIEPEDMDALAEIAGLMKKQLQRRAATPQNVKDQATAE